MFPGYVFLEVNLSMEAPSTNGTLERKLFGVRHHVFHQMILAKEPFGTHPTLERLDARVAHSVAPHVGRLRELHVANIALEEFLRVVSLTMRAQSRNAEGLIFALLATVDGVTVQMIDDVESREVLLPVADDVLFVLFVVTRFLMVHKLAVIVTFVFAKLANV